MNVSKEVKNKSRQLDPIDATGKGARGGRYLLHRYLEKRLGG